jgi:V/A-type H+-transporting ATPase subunit E
MQEQEMAMAGRTQVPDGDPMEYTDLMRSMDEGLEEKKAEVRKKAEEAVKAIRCEARARADEARKSRMTAAVGAFNAERNHALYAAKNELNKEMTALRHRLLSEAFAGASRALEEGGRGHEGYAGCYRQLVAEALGELGDDAAVLHTDPRDEELCRAVVAGLGVCCEIVPDLCCAGGLNASTRDGKVVIFNTLESRLEKARDRLKLDIFAALDGR